MGANYTGDDNTVLKSGLTMLMQVASRLRHCSCEIVENTQFIIGSESLLID